ncbi:hypothetical protein KVV02_003019 [Mortierella alpina]|uniref:Early meiotic induction protein 1 n=1 Tax=Mortierella alpina TaxID=64518 RepID=A0A9P8D052_MORAP|nr:hypothetical protein KVV02_003019 [Mortierella alpina]
MGWFSKSTVAPVDQDSAPASEKNVPVVKEESSQPALSTPSSDPTAQPQPQPQAQSQTQPQRQPEPVVVAVHPSAASDTMEFNEYKTPDDIYARFKVSDAMNELAACSSLGSNIRNYYRYGTFKDCAARYDHLKFCLAIKTKSSQVAQVMIQKRDAELRAKKRSMPNSEDVWTART